MYKVTSYNTRTFDLCFIMSCSQIWLIPFVDDHHHKIEENPPLSAAAAAAPKCLKSAVEFQGDIAAAAIY